MTKLIAIAGMAFVLAVTVISAAYGHDVRIQAHHPLARPTIAGRPGVVYLRLHNHSRTGVVVTGAHTPMATSAEIHTSSMTGGIMKMRRVERLELPAKGAIEFKPGGYHIMLLGLEEPLKEGMKFPLTLTFDGAEPIEFIVKVRKNAGRSEAGDHSGHDSEHHGHGDDDDDDKNKKDPLTGKKIKTLTPSPD